MVKVCLDNSNFPYSRLACRLYCALVNISPRHIYRCRRERYLRFSLECFAGGMVFTHSPVPMRCALSFPSSAHRTHENGCPHSFARCPSFPQRKQQPALSIVARHVPRAWPSCQHLKHCRGLDLSCTTLTIDQPSLIFLVAPILFAASIGHWSHTVFKPFLIGRMGPNLISVAIQPPASAVAVITSSPATDSSSSISRSSPFAIGRATLAT